MYVRHPCRITRSARQVPHKLTEDHCTNSVTELCFNTDVVWLCSALQIGGVALEQGDLTHETEAQGIIRCSSDLFGRRYRSRSGKPGIGSHGQGRRFR